MPYPTLDEFRGELLSRPLEDVVRTHVFQGIPYVFRASADAHAHLRAHLAKRLGATEEDITVVGSAKIGFSLSPHTFGRPFLPTSDIDVMVVSETLFDSMWFALLRWHYPRLSLVPAGGSDWATARRREVFLGRFEPDRIQFNRDLPLPHALTPVRDHATHWFDAFRSLSRLPAFAKRQVSGRLYRTWEHALLYHLDGLRQIKESISGVTP